MLAVSENDVQLKDFLWSYVQGVELAGRLGQQFQPQHVKDGWHATATIGTLAATAAIGSLNSYRAIVFRNYYHWPQVKHLVFYIKKELMVNH